jgi:hypothetical protein
LTASTLSRTQWLAPEAGVAGAVVDRFDDEDAIGPEEQLVSVPVCEMQEAGDSFHGFTSLASVMILGGVVGAVMPLCRLISRHCS